MSLDASSWLGGLCRGWEPLFFPPPAPSFLAFGVFTSKLGFYNRFFSNEVWFVIGLSLFIWFPFHRPPQTVFFFPLFFHALHPHPFPRSTAPREAIYGVTSDWESKSLCCGDFGSLRRCSSQRVGSGSLFSIGLRLCGVCVCTP